MLITGAAVLLHHCQFRWQTRICGRAFSRPMARHQLLCPIAACPAVVLRAGCAWDFCFQKDWPRQARGGPGEGCPVLVCGVLANYSPQSANAAITSPPFVLSAKSETLDGDLERRKIWPRRKKRLKRYECPHGVNPSFLLSLTHLSPAKIILIFTKWIIFWGFSF